MQNSNGHFAGRIRGATPADVDFTLELTPLDVEAAPASSEVVTVNDTIYQDDIAAVVDHAVTISAVDAPDPVSFSSLDPDILTVDSASGQVSWVANGMAGVLAKLPLLTKRIDVPVSQSVGAGGRRDRKSRGVASR